jgi:protein involved in polysaccharide export with SLBB domain
VCEGERKTVMLGRSMGRSRRRRPGLLLWVLGLLLLSMGIVTGGASAQQIPKAPLPSVPSPNVPKLPGSQSGSSSSDVRLPDAAPPPARPQAPAPKAPGTEPLQPFGANLFMGNFLRAREDGLNPNYVILPGDHVAVNTWGAVEISSVFVVDGQGNIFIPEIGPVRLAGVKNADLTAVVRQGLSRVYARHFDVYTNLITAKPVAVYVTGGVNRPGRYAGVPSDSVLFFLDQAGGIDANLGSYRRVSVLRGGMPVADVDLYDFILHGKLDSPQFKDGDTILVQQRGPVVELRGDVAAPALIEFSADRFSGDQALRVIPGAARATEVTIEGVRNGVPIGHTLSLAAFSKFPLHDGDTITLREEGRANTILVNLEGEFEGASVLAVRRGARLVDVLNYIEVDPRMAHTDAVHIKRASVARQQKESIDNSLFRLERSALLALSDSNGESDIRRKEAELVLQFTERARLIQPLGRVVTSYSGRQRNVMLEDGDVIVIPARTNVVRVSGEVLMSQAVMFKPGLSAEEYVELAGGYTDRADEGRVIILHPDASVGIGDDDAAVYAGDEVLVPPRVDIKTIQNIADITQIIYQIAVSGAVAIALTQ